MMHVSVSVYIAICTVTYSTRVLVPITRRHRVLTPPREKEKGRGKKEKRKKKRKEEKRKEKKRKEKKRKERKEKKKRKRKKKSLFTRRSLLFRDSGSVV
jgi:hypothetical protein